MGFQAIARHPELPDDWADIATFARVIPKTPGVGRALFAKTRTQAKNTGISTISATIRADNRGGLIFYEKMGFQTYSVAKDAPLEGGTLIDRISKSYLVE